MDCEPAAQEPMPESTGKPPDKAGITLSGRYCSVCTSPARNEIDAMLVEGIGSRKISAQYNIPRSNIQRHAARHLTPSIRAARAAEVEAQKKALLERGRAARREVRAPLDEEEKDQLLTQANAALLRAEAVSDLARREDLAGSASILRLHAHTALARAARSNDLRAMNQSINTALKCLELMGQLTGKLEAAGGITINTVVNAPAFVSIQNRIVQALADYPEARQRVLEALADE